MLSVVELGDQAFWQKVEKLVAPQSRLGSIRSARRCAFLMSSLPLRGSLFPAERRATLDDNGLCAVTGGFAHHGEKTRAEPGAPDLNQGPNI